jgi:hypothetical protein
LVEIGLLGWAELRQERGDKDGVKKEGLVTQRPGTGLGWVIAQEEILQLVLTMCIEVEDGAGSGIMEA